MADESVADFLQHYGVVGMKWGKRKGGLRERVKGAALDRNQQKQAITKRAANDKETREEKIVNAPLRLIVGKKRYQKYAAMSLVNLKAQQKRIESGKTNFFDKLETFQNTNTLDLLVSRRDNKG